MMLCRFVPSEIIFLKYLDYFSCFTNSEFIMLGRALLILFIILRLSTICLDLSFFRMMKLREALGSMVAILLSLLPLRPMGPREP